jgi:hypothetical protein
MKKKKRKNLLALKIFPPNLPSFSNCQHIQDKKKFLKLCSAVPPTKPKSKPKRNKTNKIPKVCSEGP